MRRVLLASAALLVATAGSAAAAPSLAPPPRPPAYGPNLVLNPGFEASALETGPVAPGSLPQPVLPTGWSVEGLTLLFDHSPHTAQSGKRGAAISGALGGGRQICDASSGSYKCTPNPAYAALQPVEKAALETFSIRPFWRTAAPVPVTAGKAYRFAVFAIRPSLDPNAQVQGEGAETKVRWTRADGSTISVVDGPKHLAGPKRVLGWKEVALNVTPPVGATGAVLLLGHSEYTNTSGQVAFDNVFFGLARR